MAKIRIREMLGKPAVPAVSLGNVQVSEGKTIKGRNRAGEEFEQWMPGAAFCRYLVPTGTATADNHVDLADVDEEIARVLCDEKGICERVRGRPRGQATAEPEAPPV